MEEKIILLINNICLIYLTTGVLIALIGLQGKPLEKPSHIMRRTFAIFVSAILWLPLQIAFMIIRDDNK